MSVICPACAAVNRDGARHCKNCGGALATESSSAPLNPPVALPQSLVTVLPEAQTQAARVTALDTTKPTPAAHPLAPTHDAPALTAEDLEEGVSSRGPLALYAGAAIAGIVLAGGLAWWLLRDAPALASAPGAPRAVVAATATTPARTPDEEIITERAEPSASTAPEPPAGVAPAATVPVEMSAPVASAPARPAPARQRTAPGASNEPPWQHPGSRAPAPASLSAAGAAPVPAAPPVAAEPMPAPDPLAPLRADLRQCDGESNILGKGVCVVRVRHRHCGNHWGKVPECPLSQRNHDPYNN